uniref:Putative nucleotidyltransferase n=1 Tax=Sphaerisporangium sp. SANK 60911 TaxID=1354075 RepID=V5YS96_9ACTN|nr:putative nucleotidyltransferase [Sphaerisporangium sp. SANK 60911]
MAPGTTVLDRCLAPLLHLAATGTSVRLVAVVNAERVATMAYLGVLAERLDVAVVFQPPSTSGSVAAAVARALPLCEGPVLLCMPDQYFDPPRDGDPAGNPIRAALSHLDAAEWAVLASPVRDPDVLRVEGALRVEERAGGHTVAAAAEKPADPGPFNAVWAAVICADGTKARWPALFDPAAASPLVGAPAVMVSGYRHMTTPEFA